MLTHLSGQNRTRREALSPKVVEQRHRYDELALSAAFRAYPCTANFSAEVCFLQDDGVLELFWTIHDLGGPAPGGWYQVHDLALQLTRVSDQKRVTLALTPHIAGFDAWYRMRGGMVPVLPSSYYFNLEAGDWLVTLTGSLQDAQPLCLFADAYHDLFHYSMIKEYYDRAKAPMLERKVVTDQDLVALQPLAIEAGLFSLAEGCTAPIGYRQKDRLHAVSVSFADVAGIDVPAVELPVATPLDPITVFRKQLHYLQDQSIRYNHCPYDTVNHWDHPPDFDRDHFYVNERTAYFHIESLAPLYRVTGNPDTYRAARKWYEWIARNIWPAPGGIKQICHGSRTVWGSALHIGGMTDAVCTFAEIDQDPRWVAPLREGILDWPMHPTIPRPLMDQDAWGVEEMNTTGTYNMCTHFALAAWRSGHFLGDDALKAKAEQILYQYTFPGEEDGIWPYRPGPFPSHHYDMYLKWQLARLLLTGADRWTQDEDFLDLFRRSMDASLSTYSKLENGELYFPDWTHNVNETSPANAARHGCAQLETLVAVSRYVDDAYLEPLTQTLRGLYRLLALPEVDPCWHGSWFHVHGNLLSLALNGLHVEGNSVAEMRVVKA